MTKQFDLFKEAYSTLKKNSLRKLKSKKSSTTLTNETINDNDLANKKSTLPPHRLASNIVDDDEKQVDDRGGGGRARNNKYSNKIYPAVVSSSSSSQRTNPHRAEQSSVQQSKQDELSRLLLGNKARQSSITKQHQSKSSSSSTSQKQKLHRNSLSSEIKSSSLASPSVSAMMMKKTSSAKASPLFLDDEKSEDITTDSLTNRRHTMIVADPKRFYSEITNKILTNIFKSKNDEPSIRTVKNLTKPEADESSSKASKKTSVSRKNSKLMNKSLPELQSENIKSGKRRNLNKEPLHSLSSYSSSSSTDLSSLSASSFIARAKKESRSKKRSNSSINLSNSDTRLTNLLKKHQKIASAITGGQDDDQENSSLYTLSKNSSSQASSANTSRSSSHQFLREGYLSGPKQQSGKGWKMKETLVKSKHGASKKKTMKGGSSRLPASPQASKRTPMSPEYLAGDEENSSTYDKSSLSSEEASSVDSTNQNNNNNTLSDASTSNSTTATSSSAYDEDEPPSQLRYFNNTNYKNSYSHGDSSESISYFSSVSEQPYAPYLFKSNFKSITLSYYHHLYNEKQKARLEQKKQQQQQMKHVHNSRRKSIPIDMNAASSVRPSASPKTRQMPALASTNNNDHKPRESNQPLLYKVVYGEPDNNNDVPNHKWLSEDRSSDSRTKNVGQIRPRNFQSEFNKRYSLMNPPSSNQMFGNLRESYLDEYSTSANHPSFHENNSRGRSASSETETDSSSFSPSVSSNTATYSSQKNTNSNQAASKAAPHSLSQAMPHNSANSQATNSEIKFVKFKNYGLHKSLGENLNNIDSMATSHSSTNNTSGGSSSRSQVAHRASNQNALTSKSTVSLHNHANRNSNDFEASNILSRNNATTQKFNESMKPTTTSERTNQSVSSYPSSSFTVTRGMYKSCSPHSTKRNSQVEFKYASPNLIDRAQSNFTKTEPSRPPSVSVKDQRPAESPVRKPSNTGSISAAASEPAQVNKTSPVLAAKPSQVNKPVQLSIDTKNPNNGPITAQVKHNDKLVKFDIIKQDETKYDLRFLPVDVGIYHVSIFMGGQEVKGSPFTIKIENKSSEPKSAPLLPVTDNNGAPSGPPANLRRKPELSKKFIEARRRFSSVSGLPSEKPSSPVTPNEKNVRVEVIYLPNDKTDDYVVNEEVVQNVRIVGYDLIDKSIKIPLTSVEAQVKHDDKFVNHRLEPMANGNYQLKFTPQKTGSYLISFLRNGTKIDETPYKINVKGKFLKEIQKPSYCQVGLPYTMLIDYCNITNLRVSVYTRREKSEISPSASSCVHPRMCNVPVEKTIEADSKLRIRFIPLEPIEHILDITDNGLSIEGFPIKLNVYPTKEVFMVSENINGVRLGQNARFKIYLNGQADLLNIKITNIDAGNIQHVSFLLEEDYVQIHQVFAALYKALHLSPTRVKNRELIKENGKTRVNFCLIEDSTMSHAFSNTMVKMLKELINSDQFQIQDVNRTIRAVPHSVRLGPRGENVGFKLEKQQGQNALSSSSGMSKNFDYMVDFKPTSLGRYRIDVENFNKPIINSPNFINVYDLSQVELLQIPDLFIVGNEHLIDINLNRAGHAPFDIVVESPSGIKLPFKVDNDLTKRIKFIPREKGVHRVFMKLGDYYIDGSPFEIEAVESLVPNFFGNGLYYGIENESTAFYVYAPKYLDGNLSIEIIDGKQNNIKANIEKLTETLYEIKYLPVEIGLLNIVIKYNDIEVPNSPYTVRILRPNRVKMLTESGVPLNNVYKMYDLEVNQERVLCFDTSEAGPGQLIVDINTPHNEKLPYRLTKESLNLYRLSFTPFYDGQYKMSFGLNNFPIIMLSPIVGRTLNYSVLNEIKVYGVGAYQADLNKEAEFFIDCSRIKDLDEFPQVSFKGFFSNNTSNELKINVNRLHDNIYRCTYVAEKPGRYVINITFNKAHLSCSPLEINVGPIIDLNQIKINRDEFKSCILGEEIRTVIDTRDVGGPGELTAYCTGSHKPAHCEFVDQQDGTYLLKVKPEELGKHLLQIKFNDENLPGSPFSLRVSAPPDATKVNVIGPGICHGILEGFESKFLCNTKGAGAGQLTVRIRGPKGAFRVDMQRRDEKDRTIICKYDPQESGEYEIHVKWSGKHVPNSPFNVQIFKSKEELNAYLANHPNEREQLKEKHQAYLSHDSFKTDVLSAPSRTSFKQSQMNNDSQMSQNLTIESML